MQRTAGNQATMRAIAASASPTPPTTDGDDHGDAPPSACDAGDEPKLTVPRRDRRAPTDPSSPNATGPGSGPDRPRG